VAEAGCIVSAFTEDQVERLTGITKRQLGHWDRTGFFKPAFGAESRRVAFARIYSFKDVVALRVLSSLRNQFGVSLQHLRQVSEKLSHLDDERWTKTTLYVLKKRVVFSDPETGQPREIVSGQYALGIPLQAVASQTREDVERLYQRRDEQLGKITQNRLVSHNAPVVAGTRIPTVAIKRFRDAGYSVAQIIGEYPDLTEQDVLAALAHEEKKPAA
jgi:DNA-binding transcriptional MerR regulator